jgi:ribosomal-protein-alanine N-acetyltransferase
MVQAAIEHNASWMTLEVRESNIAAQKLYRKYGFTTVSTRNSYYTDNHENALVMWAGNLRGALYRNKVHALRAALEAEILGGKR